MKKQNKEIKNHEDEYIHIPKHIYKRMISFTFGLFLLFLSYKNLIFILYKSKLLGLNLLLRCDSNCINYSNLAQLDIIPNLLLEFFLIFGAILFVFNIYNSMDYKKFYLIVIQILTISVLVSIIIGAWVHGLICAFIYGLLSGLFMGLFIGLLFGMDFGMEETK